MQATEDGEFVPVKELDKSFKIPKKRDKAADEAAVPAQNYVLESSYYNYQPEMMPGVNPAPLLATAAAVSPTSAEHVQNLVVDILQRQAEKPKTYSNHILRDTIPDVFDESLPRELTTQFQPLYCKLCSAQLSSNVVAKLHYKSKNHEKKIRKFLIDHATQTGQPPHPRANVAGRKDEDEGEPQNPRYFYCDVCDLPLTGKLHAESHYMGKNHRRAILGIKKPAGKGFYDNSGKWVRLKRPADDDASPTGDTFGQDFHQPAKKPALEHGCTICNITTTCAQQLESHLKGQRHLKRVKQLGLGLSSPATSPDPFQPDAAPSQDNFGAVAAAAVTVPDAAALVSDCSVYRTPSGQYYCPVCNLSMNSVVQFKQHLNSKNHMKKNATQKRS